jgi:hypothetical protein
MSGRNSWRGIPVAFSISISQSAGHTFPLHDSLMADAKPFSKLNASGEDVKRWLREKRNDILKCADVWGSKDDPIGADLGVTPDGDEEIRRQCKPWAPRSICEDVPDEKSLPKKL